MGKESPREEKSRGMTHPPMWVPNPPLVDEHKNEIYKAIVKAVDKLMKETSVVKPPIQIIPLELAGSPLEEKNVKRWIEGIKEAHPSLQSSLIIEKDQEKDYEHNKYR